MSTLHRDRQIPIVYFCQKSYCEILIKILKSCDIKLIPVEYDEHRYDAKSGKGMLE